MTTLDLLRKLLITPLLAHRPPNTDSYDYLEEMWDLKNRIISRYYVEKDFAMLGTYLAQDTIPVSDPTTLDRKVKRGQNLWARVDDRTGQITVDLSGKVFLVTREEWQKIRRKLTLGKTQQEI